MRSIGSIVAGLVIMLAAAALLFWNEGRALSAAQALAEGGGLVTTVDGGAVDARNEGRLVFLTGTTTAPSGLHDDDLGFDAKGLRLSRKVEMFQWRELHRSRGSRDSGSEGDFTYSRVWSAEPIDWTRFRFPQDHRNPPMPPVGSRDLVATDARLGTFRIGDRIIAKLGQGQAFNPPAAIAGAAQDKLGQSAQPIQGGVFVGGDPAAPRIGDIRILYTLVPHQTASVVGRQSGDTISTFQTSNGDPILLVRPGAHAAADMFASAESANAVMTWAIRLLGLVIVFVGCRVILRPVRMIASYVPLVDSVASLGVTVVALVATLVIGPFVIALAWLFHRPLTALLVAAAGIGLAACLLAYHRHARTRLPTVPG